MLQHNRGLIYVMPITWSPSERVCVLHDHSGTLNAQIAQCSKQATAHLLSLYSTSISHEESEWCLTLDTFTYSPLLNIPTAYVSVYIVKRAKCVFQEVTRCPLILPLGRKVYNVVLLYERFLLQYTENKTLTKSNEDTKPLVLFAYSP